MRIVLDTNVVVSALVWGGTPYELVRMAIDGEVLLCTSPALLDELHEVLTRAHLSARLDRVRGSVDEAISLYGGLSSLGTPAHIPRVVPDDADDDHVIAAAVTARAYFIVTGDRHLLTVENHQSIRIVTPADAVRLLKAS